MSKIINCTDIDACVKVFLQIPNFKTLINNFYGPLYISIVLVSLIGIVLNVISVSILSLRKFKDKFNKYLLIFSINSALLNFNDFLMFFSSLLFNSYNLNYSYSKGVYMIFYYVLWSVLYSIGGFLDIFIIYERIQLINPKLSLLLKEKASRISIAVFFFCLIINIPINLSRRIESMQLLVNSSDTLILYKYTNSGFAQDLSFQIFSYICNFIRDIVSLILEIAANVVLVIVLKRFYANKLALGLTNEQAKSMIKKNERNNMKLAFVNSLLSGLTHLFSFFVFMFLKYGYQNPVVLFLGFISILVNSFRHSLNFVLFYRFNKKFRKETGCDCKLVMKFSCAEMRSSINTSQDLRDFKSDESTKSEKNLKLIAIQYIHLDNCVTRL